MLKAYASTFAPVVVLFLAIRMPYTFRVGKNAISAIIWILAIGLVLNFANTIHLFRQGYGGLSILTDESGDVGMFYIPLINATLGVFTMRVLAPTAVIFAFAFLCQPGWFKAQTLLLKVLVVSVLGLGLLGSVVKWRPSGSLAFISVCRDYCFSLPSDNYHLCVDVFGIPRCFIREYLFKIH